MNERGWLDHAVDWTERGWIPDALVRFGIRRLCAERLREQPPEGQEDAALQEFSRLMRTGPVAPVPEKANEQHYELPAAFFQRVLGRHLKYSSAYWPDGVLDLDEAEAAALEESCRRAELCDGQDILELGCGWGSLSLWMAERFPSSRITAVSNSSSQKRFIDAKAKDRQLENLQVITADMNAFAIDRTFDRVVSIEMFEHMRNYQLLLRRIAGWLKPDGRLFVHIFCHRRFAYCFETEGSHNWMGQYFFTGGIMPGRDLLGLFADDLRVEEQWMWDGSHYQKTAEAWLQNLDAHRQAIMPVLEMTYGPNEAARWLQRWRVFFMACGELFGYRGGAEWGVAHYRLEPVPHRAPTATSTTKANHQCA